MEESQQFDLSDETQANPDGFFADTKTAVNLNFSIHFENNRLHAL